MTDQWFYRLFGQEFGPMPFEELRDLADSGTIQALDYVRSSTSSEWVAAVNIEKLGLSTSERRTAATIEATCATEKDISIPKDEWYCQFGGQELGPLSFANLLEYVELGQLTGDDEVRFGGNGNWRKVASIGRLMAALPYESVERSIRPNRITSVSSSVERPPASPVSRVSSPQAQTVPVQSIESAPVAPQSPARQPVQTPTVTRPQQTEIVTTGYGISTSRTSPSTFDMNRSTPSSHRPITKKKRTSEPGRLSEALESLKDPKALGSACAIAVLLLIFGWGYLPKSRGADIRRYQTLKSLVDEIRAKRTSAPAELSGLQQKLVKAAKEIVEEVKDKAGRDEPAKQNLLWACRDEVPRFVQAGIAVESASEKNLIMRLQDAAIELGLEKPPAIEVTQTPKPNNDG